MTETKLDEPVDAELVPEHEHHETSVTTTDAHALERREVRNEVLMPLDTDEVVRGMEAYQQLLPRLLNAGDWQGPPGEPGSFVKKSGWRKIARAFNLSLEVVQGTVERDEHGSPIRANVIARAVAPNGVYQDGDGYCSIDESRFDRAGGRQKLENDLRATATTRAKNRAISDLVGMGEVSAEEMQPGGNGGKVAPASKELRSRASRALTYLLDGNVDAAERTWGEIKAVCGGALSEHAANTLLEAARALKAIRTSDVPADTEGLDEPATVAGDDEIPFS